MAEAAAAAEAEARAAEELAAAERAAETARQQQAEAKRRAEEQARRQRELEAQAAAADAAEKERLQREAAAAAKKAAEAEAARKAAAAEAQRREEERRARLAAEAAAAAEAEAKRKAEEEARRKAEEEARRKAEAEAAQRKAAAEAEAKRLAAEEAERLKAAEVAKAAAKVEVPGTCGLDELVRLEPMAMLGKLSDSQISACEETLAGAPKMTDKDKVSRVLMANAFSKGDKATWEQLVKRHLDEIDQSDPDLCFEYARHLSKKGPSRASGVIRWVNVALENRIVWSGDTYTSRVYSLHKLRASASQDLWQAAEAAYNDDPSPGNQDKIDKNRAMTKVNAREWYEYAKSAGKDTTLALQLCMSAAGTKDYCEAG